MADDSVLGPSGEIVSKAAVSAMGVDGWWQSRELHEPWPGAFQQGYESGYQQNALACSAVYTCVTLIANDIAKLRPRLMEFDRVARIWTETESSAFSPVLRKQNRYQTRIQFFVQWLASKLLTGNTYVLKEYDQRGVVSRLYILDPSRVTPVQADDGDVYYQVGADYLSGIRNDLPYVPATDIIHDKMFTPYHPLCGVSPIYACAMSAQQSSRIQRNSNQHFQNQSRPGGVLLAPGKVDEPTAIRLKQQAEAATSGINSGRLLVLTDGMKYEPIGMTAVDSQLIEQLRWTVEDIARAFLVPMSKLSPPANATGKSTAQEDLYYYKQTLQIHIEAIEILLDEALGLGVAPNANLGVEFDLDGLLRMDPETRANVHDKLVRAALMKPNEGRRAWDLPPVPGGDACYLQQQNYSLEALAKRDAGADPFGTAAKPAPAAPTGDAEAAAAEEARVLIETIQKGLANAI